MDPLSDLLSLLKPVSRLSGGMNAGGAWSIRFLAPEGIRFQIVMAGECWLTVDGVAEPLALQAGDGVLLPRRRAFQLATATGLQPVEAVDALAGTQEPIPTINGGGQFFSMWSVFAVTGKAAEVLLQGLPAVIHVRRDTEHPQLQRSIDRLMLELKERKPGFSLVSQSCSYTMLVDLLRQHLAAGSDDGVGWLFALADQRISRAINLMHTSPSRSWTLDALAKDCGMSRSAFAILFKTRVGKSPMQYLTHWRMLVAGDRLTSTNESLSTIAESLGYESESSFSNAFKRVMGCSPRRFSGMNT